MTPFAEQTFLAWMGIVAIVAIIALAGAYINRLLARHSRRALALRPVRVNALSHVGCKRPQDFQRP